MPLTLNEQKFLALTNQGYTGTLNEMEYAWLADQCSPAPPADPDVLWGGAEFTSISQGVSFETANIYFYNTANGIPGLIPAPFDATCGYFFPDSNAQVVRVIAEAVTPFNLGEYLVKFDIVTVVIGDGIIQLNNQPGREGEYWDLFQCDIRTEADAGGTTDQEILCDITVATYQSGDPAAGTGVPVPGSEKTRRVRFIAQIV